LKKILILILFGLCFGQNAPPFDGNRAMNLLQTQCDFGPRFPESEGHVKMKKFMVQFLQPLADSLYIMDEKIPHPYKRHYITLTNFLARFNLDADYRIMLMAHWDTREFAEKPIPPNFRCK